MNNILEVRGLNKSYDTFALKDVSFAVPKGYIMGFIGPNGAGKTTTLKSILNMVNYQSGVITLFGRDNAKENACPNEQIGVVMDSPFFVDDWNLDDIEKAVSIFYNSWDRKKYTSLLKQFNIARKLKFKELSRGMKVKLMIAVALSHEAQFLILDEPTSGLDPAARDELCGMLGDFVTDENKSILFSTHITTDLEKIADYITFIMNGRIIFTGTKEALLEKYVLVKGGLNEITPEQQRAFIGLRKHGTGFEGMIEAVNLNKLPHNIFVEPVTLEDIIIYMNKGAKSYE